jgi:hypothetical protein
MNDHESPYTPLRDRLEPGERLLWNGQPNPRMYMFRGGWLLLPFSILWFGFAIFWEATVILSGAPILFWLWGVPFLLIGFYMTVGRFWMAAREAARTFYGVTNRRILIESGVFNRQFVSIDLFTLPYLQLTEQGNGRGTVTFAPGGPLPTVAGGAWVGGLIVGGVWTSRGTAQPPAFIAIDHAAEVYRIIEQARREAQQARPPAETRPLRGSGYSF